MKVTAKQVAARAGVSVSAVSRAFRPGASIAKETRSRILRIAGEMGYTTPSGEVVARLGTGTIALIAGDLANPFYPSVLEALSEEVRRRGRRLILHVAPVRQDIDGLMRQVLDYRSDGAIITSATLSSRLARACRAVRLPVVLFNRTQPGRGISSVSCDNFAGGVAIAERFLKTGRRRIAMIGGLLDTSTHLERRRGFVETLNRAGTGLYRERPGRFEYQAAYRAATDLLAERPRPDAIFCVNDVMALAAVDALKAAGVVVPDDIAIIGSDDIPMAQWHSYRLTTMRQRIGQMARDALDLIEETRHDPSLEGSLRMAPGKMILRQTG